MVSSKEGKNDFLKFSISCWRDFHSWCKMSVGNWVTLGCLTDGQNIPPNYCAPHFFKTLMVDGELLSKKARGVPHLFTLISNIFFNEKKKIEENLLFY